MYDNKIFYDKDKVNEALVEFYKLYQNRPIKQNDGGMKSPHLFNTWFCLKQLQPDLVIESGVWKGLGTWTIEKAAPLARIISIETDYSNLEFSSEKVIYLNKDIAAHDWESIFNERFHDLNRDKIVIFLDDHQDLLDRIEYIYELGIKHILYEDNYPVLQGDVLSPKKILAREDYIIDRAGKRELRKFSYFDYEKFIKYVKIYQELPPIFKTEKTRWGDTWDNIKYPTEKELLAPEEKEKFPIYFDEATSYTWICYLELN